MTLQEALHRISAEPSAPLSPEVEAVLRAAMERYPFFSLPAALLLRGASLDEGEAEILRARVAVLTSDKVALASLAAQPDEDPARFYPPSPAPAPVSTDSAIDTFLDTYGRTSPEEDALLERLIFNPVPDYADILAAEAPEPSAATDGQDAMIDAFLKKESDAPAPAPTLPENVNAPVPESQPDTSLRESLARIFIEQGRYSRALEIISNLAARNPERNPFFADQVRFLKKLVAIDSMLNSMHNS